MSEQGRMSRRDELEALLPFYLNGTLEGAELGAVEAWLASDPDAMAALEEADRELSATNAANEAIRPPADALSRFSKVLEHEAGPARDTARASLLAAAWQRLVGLPAGLAWATAAVALLLVAGQAAYRLSHEQGRVEIAGTDEDPAKLPFALVVFKPDAKMADVMALLDQVGGKIVGGPLPDGMFKVALPVKTVAEYDRVAGVIGAAPITASILYAKKPSE